MRPLADASNHIAVWQGFSHRWQYNHRLNRIGSYVGHSVSPDGACRLSAVHTAASGTGPDRAEYVDPFTLVQARRVGFQCGVCEVKLVAGEQERVSFCLPEIVALEASLAGKERYAVVLNGFDLAAEGDAKKLMALEVGVTDPEPTVDRAALALSVYGALRADCHTPECNRRAMDGNRVRYRLRVHYGIIAGNREDFCWTDTEPVTRSAAWNRRNELARSPTGRAATQTQIVAGTPGFGGSIWAFKKLAITLHRKDVTSRLFWRKERAMHLLEWNASIWDTRALGDRRFTCALDLSYANWRKGMRWRRLPFSLFAYRDAGEAQLTARLVLLQFKEVDGVQAGVHDGSIDWPGGNREARDDPAAIRRLVIC